MMYMFSPFSYVKNDLLKLRSQTNCVKYYRNVMKFAAYL